MGELRTPNTFLSAQVLHEPTSRGWTQREASLDKGPSVTGSIRIAHLRPVHRHPGYPLEELPPRGASPVICRLACGRSAQDPAHGARHSYAGGW